MKQLVPGHTASPRWSQGQARSFPTPGHLFLRARADWVEGCGVDLCLCSTKTVVRVATPVTFRGSKSHVLSSERFRLHRGDGELALGEGGGGTGVGAVSHL